MTTHLLGLRAENYKRLELVEVSFPEGGGVVAIMGENEAGKTSLLDAFEASIAGRNGPKATRPVRAGAETARIIATFDDIVVTRTYRADGQTAIKVTAADGRRVDRAEDLLNRLYSRVALDPLAFSRLSDAEQVATLLPMIGFDPAPIKARRDEAYDLRTVKNREVGSLRARFDAMPVASAALPVDEISVAEVTSRLETAIAHNTARAEADRAAVRAVQEVNIAAEGVAKAEEALAVAKRLLADANAIAVKKTEEFDALAAEVNVDALRAEIDTADATNKQIRDARDRTRLAAELAAAEKEAADLTARIDAADGEKEAALAAAADKMPVPGLSIDDDGILTLDGIPFSQASTGVKIRTGTAVAMALNPNLRVVIIRDASLLDPANRKVIDDLAKANGFLVLMEIADESMPVGVVIEDGAVREVRS